MKEVIFDIITNDSRKKMQNKSVFCLCSRMGQRARNNNIQITNFQSFSNCPRLKLQINLILNCLRAPAIPCLSHKGQNSVQSITSKVLPSRLQVCRLSKNRLAVARGKPTITVCKKQQFQFTQSNFFTSKIKLWAI